MNDSMDQRFMKYVVCFFCSAVFLINVVAASFASGDDEAVSHNAGKDCLISGCHSSGGWKRFSIGGTIYTDAEGAATRAGAQIKVVDANGITVNLTSDQIGNFYSTQSMTAPFLITVSYRGRKVRMPGAASGGGCNAGGCHVVGSAGRVYISTEDIDLTGTVIGDDLGISSEMRYDGDVVYEKNGDWMVKYNDRESSSDRETDAAVIVNAKVSLSRKGHIKYKTTTDSTGAFTLKKVKANDYTLKVTKKGYKTYKQSYEMKQKDVLPLEITLRKK